MDDVNTSRATADDISGAVIAPGHLAPRPANAATHGLTAKKYLPEVLGPELIERHRKGFFAEWKPRTPTEVCLVEELSRHSAALERATRIEEAVLRTAACGLSSLADAPDVQVAAQDRVLAAACGSETVDRVTRYRRAHEKGFLSALARLRELRATRESFPLPLTGAPIPFRFDEAVCSQYLRRRRDAGRIHCPSCGGADGTWLVGRDGWQCRTCRRQVRARCGTVIEGSRLSLRVWFAAIAAILRDRETSTSALCELTGIQRQKIVRGMAERIRQAMDSRDAERLLAGLNLRVLSDLADSRC